MTELKLSPSDPRLGLAPITTIKAQLDRLFGSNEWLGYEPETISLELGIVMDRLLLDKIQVLQILEQIPDLFFEDPAFMLYATEVMNNNVADFDFVPMPTSLELAFAIKQAATLKSEVGGTVTFSSPLIHAVAYILRQEGYSEPVGLFSFIPPELLEKGQAKSDTENKAKAIDAYIKHMDAL
jgi:hypothetical protein